MNLNKDSKIFVAGHRGLVGQAIVKKFKEAGFKNIVTRTREEMDLTNSAAVAKFYKEEKPNVVICAAAKVGGILANNTYRADFIYQNLMIQNNVIWGAHEAGVEYLVFLGSSCIYPKACPQPMKEEYLLSGYLEDTNRPYAIAKIAGLELVDSLRRQYSRNYFSVMPTNLYGPGDNYHPDNSHVIPGLIHRIAKAKKENQREVAIWGTGKPLREFLHSEDCADAIFYLLNQVHSGPMKEILSRYSFINVGSGQEMSIYELSLLIAEIAGFKGSITLDSTKPDGTPRKLLDTTVLNDLGWKSKKNLREGLTQTIQDYLNT